MTKLTFNEQYIIHTGATFITAISAGYPCLLTSRSHTQAFHAKASAPGYRRLPTGHTDRQSAIQTGENEKDRLSGIFFNKPALISHQHSIAEPQYRALTILCSIWLLDILQVRLRAQIFACLPSNTLLTFHGETRETFWLAIVAVLLQPRNRHNRTYHHDTSKKSEHRDTDRQTITQSALTIASSLIPWTSTLLRRLPWLTKLTGYFGYLGRKLSAFQ